jgi:YbbR domain-containing protein
MILSSVRILLALSVATLLTMGCGSSEKTSPVTGKLNLPSGLKLIETDSITVNFQPDEAGKTKGATIDVKGTDSSFTINVPPGKHKVAVTVKPYPGEKDSEKRGRDISQSIGMYQMGASSLRYEVTDGPQNITIDLVKGAVNKN